MSVRAQGYLVATALIGALAGVPVSHAAALDGARLYQRHCASCHGAHGHGDGPDAALFVTPPRDLRAGFLARYSTDELVRRIRTGEPLTLMLDLPTLKARVTEVEAIAAHLERLPKVDWRLVERGEEIFTDRCEICHGPTGQPRPPAPPGVRRARDLSNPTFQRGIDDEELRVLIRHGRKGMPALVPRVPEADAPALVAFVRLLSPGFSLYARYCAACHGEDGRGAGSFVETIRRPTVVFDRAYFTRHEPEEVRAKVWHMLAEQRPAMPHLRNVLGEAEARAIVVYLTQAK